MRKKALLIEERENQVINWFAIRIQHDNESIATMYEVARGLGMSPSSHLANILNGMVDKETLERVEMHKPGRFRGWGYKLKEGTFQRPPKKYRRLTVKSSRGIEQMEMF